MAISYPTSLDTFVNPDSATDNLNTPGVLHDVEHSNANDAISALEAKVGTGASIAASGTVLRGTGAGTTAFGAVNLTTNVTGTLPVANGGTGVTSSTGTVAVVLSTSPTLITPTLGVATATSVNKVAITTPASGSTLTIANGKTLTANDTTTIGTNSITLAGGEVVTFTATNALTLTTTGSTNVTLPTSGTLSTLAGTEGLSNKRITRRVVTVTQSATPTINTDNTDIAYITGLAQAITSMTTNISGTPVNGDSLIVSITDNGSARAISWGTSFESSGNVTLPSTTVLSTRLDVAFLWNVVTSKWRCVGVS